MADHDDIEARRAAKAAYMREYRERNKARLAEQNRLWRERNPDYHKNYKAEHPPWKPADDEALARRRAGQAAWQQGWRVANPEKSAAAYRDWAARNPDYDKEYRARNPEKLRERDARWARGNPGLVRAKAHRRLARKWGAEGTFTPADMDEIRERQQDCCAACGCALCGGGEVDHIIPLSRGGSNWPSNLQWLCRFCNRSKGARTMDEFLVLRGGRRD